MIEKLKSELKDNVLILDGAMGTVVQLYKLSEEQYRGERLLLKKSDTLTTS